MHTNHRAFARVGCVPIEAISRLASDDVSQKLLALFEQEKECTHVQALLGQMLYSSASTAEPERRRILINLQREIRRGRFNQISERLANEFPEGDDLISDAIEKISGRQLAFHEYLMTFKSACAANRRVLKEVLVDEDFMKGLLLSSDSLYRNLEKYQQWNGKNLNARLNQIERGLTRYASRAAMKATPFGRFCTILPLTVQEDNVPRQVIRGPFAYSKKSLIRADKRELRALWEHLTKLPMLWRHIPVRKNASLRPVEGHFVFLYGKDDNESFRRIRIVPAIEKTVLHYSSSHECSVSCLTEAIRSSSVDEAPEKIDSFVRKLVEIGVVETYCPVQEQTPLWLGKLANWIQKCQCEQFARTPEALQELERLLDAYASGSIEDRGRISERIRTITAVLETELALPTSLSIRILEDVGSRETEFYIHSQDGMSSIIAVLQSIGTALCTVSQRRAQIATLRAFFDDRFPRESAVSFLEFYEAYYREKRERETVGKTDPEDSVAKSTAKYNPLRLKFIDEIQDSVRRVIEVFGRKLRLTPSADEVNISCSDIDVEIKGMNRPLLDQKWQSTFGQFCIGEDGQERFVLTKPGMGLGFGKYASRFLPLLPEHYTEDIRKCNDLSADFSLVEIDGDSCFNANLHPSLTNSVLVHQSLFGTPSMQNQILLVNVDVIRSALDRHSLNLVDRSSGKRIEPVDLGFLNPIRRTLSHQLLEQFSSTGPISIPLPLRGASPAVEGREVPPVQYRPRIVIDGKLVVSRRQWHVRKDVFPLATREEDPVHYFLRLNRWRIDTGIPQLVYVRWVSEHSSPQHGMDEEEHTEDQQDGGKNTKVAGRANVDAHKPQYIDFSSPLLVALIPRGESQFIPSVAIIEEVYPTQADLPTHGDRRYATEILLEYSLG